MANDTRHTRAAPCPHDECSYHRGHAGGEPRCVKCYRPAHAVASDWSAYSFGHRGGHVFFVVACECGHVHRDPSGDWSGVTIPGLEVSDG